MGHRKPKSRKFANVRSENHAFFSNLRKFATKKSTGLAGTLSSAWHLEWENAEKEVLWRMTVDGVAGGNSRVTFKCPGCPGSDLGEARGHVFWQCPVAAAVRSTIEAALLPRTQVVCRSSIWLCQAPKAVHAGVWQVVCMAAVSAMHHGRRQLWRLVKEAEKRRDATAAAAAAAAARRQQRTLLELWHIKQQISLPALVAQAARYAVSDFWGRLASFAALGQAPRSWLAQVGASHPFLSMGGRHVNLGAPHNCSMGGGNGGVLQARNVAEALETALHVQTEQQHAVGSPAADQARPVILGAQEGQCRRHGQRLTAMWEAVGVKVPSSQGATCTLVCTHRVAPRARQCSLYDLCPGVCMRPNEIDAQSSAAIP